jgi:hypothetical protein
MPFKRLMSRKSYAKEASPFWDNRLKKILINPIDLPILEKTHRVSLTGFPKMISHKVAGFGKTACHHAGATAAGP